MTEMAKRRLLNELNEWTQNHPAGFIATPAKNKDGLLNLFLWNCYIPGKVGTAWENWKFSLRMTFDDNYPFTAPKCCFDPPLYHPNVDKSGTVYMELLDEKNDWVPVLGIKEILLSIHYTIC